ncbi:MAG TPA: hypothetical protein VK324_10875 [Tepidisphaeraceae bacterium]|nr:hypothetical protein [Tepidisphaeraceae bacterium]
MIPSQVRRVIQPERDGEALYVTVGRNEVPWLYTERYYEHLMSQAPAELTPDDDRLEYDQLMFALASRIEVDKQGRVLVPDKQLKYAGDSKELTLVGVRDHLELWNRAAWAAHSEGLRQRRAAIELRARQARQAPNGS